LIPAVLPSYARADLTFERGEGPYIFTDKGERYLDFAAGIAVNVLGHAHPHLVSALKTQAEKLWHTSNLYRVPGQEKLAARLVAETFADTVFFANSGVEAIECAFKMARKYFASKGQPERYRIVTVEGAFHGRTLAAIAAGGQAKYLDGFGPKVDGFDQVGFGDLAAMKAAIGPATAAILVEPIQGEGGIRLMGAPYLSGLRELCDEHGLLLMYDEIQTGVGRTGKFFAHEWSGVTPDIMAIAKGIGGGFPMGLCLATENAARGITVGSHASTFGGNPLAMAAGNAVLDVVLAPGFLENVRRTANYFTQQLEMLRDAHPKIIESVRGQGLMIGLKLKTPNTEFLSEMVSHKMLAVTGGDNTIRLLPPLNITDAHVREAINIIATCCAAVEASKTGQTAQ
jgi:acetylornithine/N-succinyldiaminopimelate aminotransferase